MRLQVLLSFRSFALSTLHYPLEELVSPFRSSKNCRFYIVQSKNSTCTPKIATWACRHRNTSHYLATCHVLSPSGNNLWRKSRAWSRFQWKTSCSHTVQVNNRYFITFILNSVADNIFLAFFICRVKWKGTRYRLLFFKE